MTRQAILAPRLFDGTSLEADKAVLIEGDRITAVLPFADVPSSFPIIRLDGASYLAPGLVDLQVNGGGGVLFNDALDFEGLAAIAAAHRKLGTSWIQPTVISGSTRQIAAALDAARAAFAARIPGVLGLHIEGPFLNPRQRGIHPPDAIRPLATADLELLTAPFPGVLMLTLAPETIPRPALSVLRKAGVIVMAGHTEATPEEIAAAQSLGLAGFTHLFNAMPPIAARAPGPAGAALADHAGFASVIVDGWHVHATSLRLALAAKGADRLFLVSDGMPTVGSSATSFRIGETLVSLHEGRLTASDGTLAGAHLCVAEAVRNVHRLLGIAPADALRMATATPAACICRGNRLGIIGPGAHADLALFDDSCALLGTWSGGVFTAARTLVGT
ncbi:MAG: N-acetylglucosamine-6-phosphate deacetylase [Rhodospirillales bacterium]|nr:N-acetylglucosamine-6-phosphate deacetylase [Rhodospirillales bacterium]